jgi:hypothetical protein
MHPSGNSSFVCKFVTALLLLILPLFSMAQTPDATELPPPPTLPPLPAAPQGTVNCFDYYAFGSVQVVATPAQEQTLPGETLTFTGSLVNANPYPVVGGQIYVKIFKLEEQESDLTHQNGYPLVDFFLAQDNIIIPANGEIPTTFTYNTPAYMAGGEYEAAFYFTTEYRYNLLGLSFTDDVTGNKTTFTVTDGVNTPAVFDKHSVMLNDTPFRFAAFPPRFTQEEPVTATVEVVNPEAVEKVVEVEWITSRWDALLEKHEMKRETQGVLLAPLERKTLSYTPPQLATSVTFLQAILTDRDATSMLHIRFVREGTKELRINYPSIMEYPLTAGKEATVFSCLHSTNLPIISDNTLTLTLKDQVGATIHTYTYEGDVTGAMMGVKDTFVPKRDYTSFTLTAALSHQGELLDEVTITYDCTALGASCASGEEDSHGATVDIPLSTRTITYLVFFALLIIGAGLWFYRQRQRAIVTEFYQPK